MSLSKLPLELLEMIHYQILNDLDITTILENPLPASSENCWLCRSAEFQILDPATLELINFYNRLFAPSGLRTPVWEEYVRFVFPSILAMADVFYNLREAGSLSRIRKVKVLHTEGVADYASVRCNDIITVEEILQEYQDLYLDHLEYETQTPLSYYFIDPLESYDLLEEWVPELCVSPRWKKLSILGTCSYTPDKFVDLFTKHCEDIRERHDPHSTYEFDLPAKPSMGHGNGIPSVQNHLSPLLPSPCAMLSSRDVVPSWLGGAPVEPVIVVERDTYGPPGVQYPGGGSVYVVDIWDEHGRCGWRDSRKLKYIRQLEYRLWDRRGMLVPLLPTTVDHMCIMPPCPKSSKVSEVPRMHPAHKFEFPVRL